MTNQRRYFRHPTSVPITVMLADEEIVNLQALNNISTGGLSFESETPWKKGAVVTINFHAPYNFALELLKIFGKVAWCKKKGSHFDVGIEFLKPVGSAVDVVHLVEEMYHKMD